MPRRHQQDPDQDVRDDERPERHGDHQPPPPVQPLLDPHLGQAHAGPRTPAISNPSSSGRGRGRVDLSGDRALVHDHDAVGQSEDLIEVLADQEHADAAGRGLAQVLVHGLDRADIEPTGRSRGNEHARLARELAGEDDLLQVAAGEPARRGVRPRRLDVVALDHDAGAFADPAAVAASARGRPSASDSP